MSERTGNAHLSVDKFSQSVYLSHSCRKLLLNFFNILQSFILFKISQASYTTTTSYPSLQHSSSLVEAVILFDVQAVTRDVEAVTRDVQAVTRDVQAVTRDVQAVTRDVQAVTRDVEAATLDVEVVTRARPIGPRTRGSNLHETQDDVHLSTFVCDCCACWFIIYIVCY